MNTKIATILVVLMSLAPLPGRADEPGTHMAQLELKIKQIELDVALKQFEKVTTTLADASLEARLFDRQAHSEEELKAQLSRTDQKIAVLSEMKDRLREEILKQGAEIEMMRKKWGLPATGPEKLDPNVPGSPIRR